MKLTELGELRSIPDDTIIECVCGYFMSWSHSRNPLHYYCCAEENCAIEMICVFVEEEEE